MKRTARVLDPLYRIYMTYHMPALPLFARVLNFGTAVGADRAVVVESENAAETVGTSTAHSVLRHHFCIWEASDHTR